MTTGAVIFIILKSIKIYISAIIIKKLRPYGWVEKEKRYLNTVYNFHNRHNASNKTIQGPVFLR